MRDPLEMAAQFRARQGVETLDLGDRAAAVSLLTQLSAFTAEDAQMLFGVLWKVLGDIEAGASDEVTRTGMRELAVQLAAFTLNMYELADIFGFDRFGEVVERVHEARMAQHGGRVRVDDLVTLPGA